MCIKKCAVCYDKGAVAGDKGRFSIYKGVRRILTNEFTFLWETVRAGGRQKSASIWCSNSVYLYFNKTVFAYLYFNKTVFPYLYFNKTVFAYLYFNKTVFAYLYFNTALLVYLDLGWNIAQHCTRHSTIIKPQIKSCTYDTLSSTQENISVFELEDKTRIENGIYILTINIVSKV